MTLGRRPRLSMACLGLTLLLVASGTTARAQEGAETTELVNALLSGLLGFKETTGPELQDAVAEVGGVPFRSAVALDYMTPADFSRYLKEALDDEYPPARARADERMLVAFDLLAPDGDLRKIRTRLLEQNVAGFYDDRPGRKRLYSVSADRRLTPSNQLVLAHELRHALQDQYANLHGMLPANVGDFDDRRLAFVSLLEGDATLVMERYLKSRVPGLEGEEGLPGLDDLALAMPELPDVPQVLQDQLLLPYLAGRSFVHAVHRAGGWAAVRAAWEKPPTSTEQVLHPEKFLARELARAVTPPSGPPSGRMILEGVLGEALVRSVLGPGGEAAAAGWGGDLYRVYDVRGKSLLVWRSTWDTEADRREFVDALLKRFEKSHGARRTLAGASLFGRTGHSVAVREAGGEVTFFSSDDAGVLSQILLAERDAARAMTPAGSR